MNTTTKNTILNALKNASGVIDKITIIQLGSNLLLTTYAKTIGSGGDADWGTATDGKLELDDVLDFANDSGSAISIRGFGLYNSTNSVSGISDAVAYWDLPGGAITLEPGEIIRCATAEYTID